MNNSMIVFNKRIVEHIYVIFLGTKDILEILISNALHDNIIIISVKNPIITFCSLNNLDKEKYIEAIQCYVYASSLYAIDYYMLMTINKNVLDFPKTKHNETIINWIQHNFTITPLITNIIHGFNDNITTIYSNGYIKNILIMGLIVK